MSRCIPAQRLKGAKSRLLWLILLFALSSFLKVLRSWTGVLGSRTDEIHRSLAASASVSLDWRRAAESF
jgi:hypothetical protein